MLNEEQRMMKAMAGEDGAEEQKEELQEAVQVAYLTDQELKTMTIKQLKAYGKTLKLSRLSSNQYRTKQALYEYISNHINKEMGLPTF